MKQPDLAFQATVRQLQLKFTRFYTRFLSKRNLTFPQFALMSLAYHEGEAPMNHFSKRLMISLPAVTHLVDRLEREKFIKRKAHARDRRVTLIQITEKGRKAVAETQGRIQQMFVNTLLEFTPQDQSAIQQFYIKFSNQLEQQIQAAQPSRRKNEKPRVAKR